MEQRTCTCGGVYVEAWIACFIREEAGAKRYLSVDGYHCDRCGHTLVDEEVSERIARIAHDPAIAAPDETFVIPESAFRRSPGRTEVLAGVG